MLEDKDILIKTNNINSHVSVVHVPTGEIAECSLYHPQSWNKYFAIGMLTERLSYKHSSCLSTRMVRAEAIRLYRDGIIDEDGKFTKSGDSSQNSSPTAIFDEVDKKMQDAGIWHDPTKTSET